MNEQFNLRDFLFKLKDYTTGNNRSRLYGILQQQLSCDLTLDDALTVLETLFNQKKLNEQDFDIFILIFHETNCYKAIKRLEEYKHSQQSDEKTKENNIQSQSFNNKIRQCQIKKYDIILVILNILIVFMCLIVYIIKKKFPLDNKRSEGIIVVKQGVVHGQTSGGHGGFSDSVTATLNFNHRITRIEGTLANDLNGTPVLGCITFHYSHDKPGHTYGCNGDLGLTLLHSTFKLYPKENITEVITYRADRNITNSHRAGLLTHLIVGIHFGTDGNRNYSFGPRDGIKTTEKFKDYSVGFVFGKSGGYIDCLRFVWYKYCSKNSIVFE